MAGNEDNSGGNRQTEHRNGQTHLFFLSPSQRGEEQGRYDVITDLLRTEDNNNNNNNKTIMMMQKTALVIKGSTVKNVSFNYIYHLAEFLSNHGGGAFKGVSTLEHQIPLHLAKRLAADS